jgi:protein SCO1/2
MRHDRGATGAASNRHFGIGVLTVLVGCFFALAPPAPAETPRPEASAESLPGESVYQLPMSLIDQNGRTLTLAELRGQPVLVAMFYTSCDNVCPMIAWHLHRMEQAVSDAQRARLRVLLVSFDPARDTPEALRRFADAHRADPARWVVARTDASEVRDLAAVLGIRYRELEGGAFNHSSVITLLDADGLIRARTSDLKSLDPEFMATVEATLQ